MARSPQRRSLLPWLLMAAFAALLGWLVLDGRLPLLLPGLYLLLSGITFVVYALDKSAARRNEWRVRESTLHLLALLCGWPGALAGQRLLRHKSSKTSFLVVFWITLVLHLAALGWLLFTPAGASLLSSLLAVLPESLLFRW